MITVSYAPSNADWKLHFYCHADFRDWLVTFICESCRLNSEFDYTGIPRDPPRTVGQYMGTGCGCEIEVDDPYELVVWDDIIMTDEERQYMLDFHPADP